MVKDKKDSRLAVENNENERNSSKCNKWWLNWEEEEVRCMKG